MDEMELIKEESERLRKEYRIVKKLHFDGEFYYKMQKSYSIFGLKIWLPCPFIMFGLFVASKEEYAEDYIWKRIEIRLRKKKLIK